MNIKGLKRTRRGVSAVATAGTLATGVLLGFSSPAMADSAACNPGCTAYAEFASYGEHLTIHDYAKDGHPTVAIIEMYYGPANGWDVVDWVEDHNGYDGPPVSKNLSFPEGVSVRYRACLGTFDSYWSCSSYRYDKA